MINLYFPRWNVQIPCNNEEEQKALNWQEIDWIASSSESYWVWGQNLAEIVKQKRKWKSGDLKNGWQSLSINRHKVKEYSHLFEPITDDWEGMTIEWFGRTFVLRKHSHLGLDL